MKTDRRHELQTNELADWLAQTIEKVRPYGRAIAGAILGVVVIGCVWAYLSHQSKVDEEAAWDEFYEAEGDPNPQKLLTLIDRNPIGTTVGDWSRVTLADRNLTMGVDRLFVNKAEALDLLSKALDNYNAVLKTAKDPILAQKALFGSARAYESLAQLDQARERYQRLATMPNSAYAAFSKQRVEDLNKPATKEWYAWFAKQEARPPVMQGPGMPGQRPSFDAQLPSGPDIKPEGREPLLKDGAGPDLGLPGSTGPSSTAPSSTGPATTPAPDTGSAPKTP